MTLKGHLPWREQGILLRRSVWLVDVGRQPRRFFVSTPIRSRPRRRRDRLGDRQDTSRSEQALGARRRCRRSPRRRRDQASGTSELAAGKGRGGAILLRATRGVACRSRWRVDLVPWRERLSITKVQPRDEPVARPGRGRQPPISRSSLGRARQAPGRVATLSGGFRSSAASRGNQTTTASS